MKIEEKKLREFFDKLNHDFKCPICRNNKTIILTTVKELPCLTEKGMGMEPLISVVCKNCGYTWYFNAKTAGLLDEAEKGSDEM